MPPQWDSRCYRLFHEDQQPGAVSQGRSDAAIQVREGPQTVMAMTALVKGFGCRPAVEPYLKTDRLSDTERATLMGGACAKAYGWSPKKG